MVGQLSLRRAGGGDVLAVVFVLEAHLELDKTAPIDVVARTDAPKLGAIIGTCRIREVRLGELKAAPDDGRTRIDDILAAVPRQDVAAAGEENELVIPIPRPEATSQAHLAGGGKRALIRVPDQQMLRAPIRLYVGVQIREAHGIVGR